MYFKLSLSPSPALYAWVCILAFTLLSCFAQARVYWNKRSPIIRRNLSRGIGFVWNSVSNFKSIGKIANSLGSSVSISNLVSLRTVGSSAFISTMNSALNLVRTRRKSVDHGTEAHVIPAQKKLSGYWFGLDLLIEDDLYSQKPQHSLISDSYQGKNNLRNRLQHLDHGFEHTRDALVASFQPSLTEESYVLKQPLSPSSGQNKIQADNLDDLTDLWKWEDDEIFQSSKTDVPITSPMKVLND